MKHINLKSIFATFLLLVGVCQVSWGTDYASAETLPDNFYYYDDKGNWGGSDDATAQQLTKTETYAYLELDKTYLKNKDNNASNEFKIFDGNRKARDYWYDSENHVEEYKHTIACGSHIDNALGDITLTAESGEYTNAKYTNPDLSITGDKFYVLLYYPNTPVNSTGAYKLAASTTLPGNTYRLVYVEKDGDEIVKFHPSSPYIKEAADGTEQKDTVSLHVRCRLPKFQYDITHGHVCGIENTDETQWEQNPNKRWVYLQQRTNGGDWQTVEGGEEEITESVSVSGVYNFIVEQDAKGVRLATGCTPYTGNYYIRTNSAKGGWSNYKTASNRISYSDYAAANRFFDYYWCEFREQDTPKGAVNEENPNLTFVIANDYSACISDTCKGDPDTRGIVDENGVMCHKKEGNTKHGANIRFSWNSKANTCDRTYIAGAGQNLWVAEQSGITYLKDENDKTGEGVFSDRGNWVYYLDLYATPGATILLKKKPYDNTNEEFYVIDDQSTQLLNGTGGKDSYYVRVLYDFKSDHLISGWIPDDNEKITSTFPIDASVVFIREGQQQANQLTFDPSCKVENVTEALGVLTINKTEYLTNQNDYPMLRDYYWVSFPFDVEVSNIFSAFELNKHFWIQRYDGATRAERGGYKGDTYWVSLNKEDMMNKGEGYVVYLEYAAIKEDNLFQHTDNLSLYFPSSNLKQIDGNPIVSTAGEHTCGIKGRETYDSNWNLLGVPAWADISVSSDIKPSDPNAPVLNIEGYNKVGFYYHFNTGKEGKNGNTWTPTEVTDGSTFQSMYSYLVQWSGTITWTTSVDFDNPSTQGLQARRVAEAETKEYTLRLEFGRDGAAADQTFVRLTEEDNVTSEFDMNYDMSKMQNAECTNVYTLIGTNLIKAGANVLPLPAENTTVYVPMGVVADKDGTYRFSMPDGTEGMLVSLADHEEGTLYNLTTGYCDVDLTKGTYEERFVLEIQPKKGVTTGCNESTTDDGTLRKVLIDGNLYIQRGDALYDAAGRTL